MPRDYVVVARRYRPQAFAELVGQEHVARALSNAIASNRVGHAYLFTGARGVGKTSAARILAKCLNCVTGPTSTPCNECDICQAVSSGDDVDVLEIDGASNRGIDEIRELRQNINIRPSRSRFKIYIIDEVHMLTTQAFNALLKTLEEPPERVKFIFCTTEAEKIPITILSRCQRFDFAGIETQSIALRLQQIAEIEGVAAEPEALELLARRAAGSMRDSQSLLEQLLAFGDRQITVADVHAMLGTAATGRIGAVVNHLTAGDAAGALADLDAALAEGVDVGQLLIQLLGFFRDAMVATVGARPETFLHTAARECDVVVATARQLGTESILAVMQILDQALGRLRYSTQPRIVAELALVRIARLENLTALAEVIQGARLGNSVTTLANPTSANPPVLTAPAELAEVIKKKLAEPGPPPAEQPPTPLPTAALTAENAAQMWRQVIASIPDTVSDFAKAFDQLAIPAPNKLVVSFRPQYSYHMTMCQRPEKLAKLEQALEHAAGRLIKIEFELLPEPPGTAEAKQADPRPVSGRGPARGKLAEKAEHPMIRRAMDLFEARPTRVDESP